jgi:AhpD family alkylhydroperoxidase
MPEHDDAKDRLRHLGAQTRAARHEIPDVYAGFAALHEAALGPGALDTRTKELIAFAIGVAEGCDGCIASHARGAVRAGATRAEAAEAIGVAILMRGGPATVHGAGAFATFCELAEEAAARAA